MTAPANPGFWRNFADWLHNAEDAVKPEVLDAVHELHALAEKVTAQDAKLEALAAFLGPEAVAAVKAVEAVATDVENATGA